MFRSLFVFLFLLVSTQASATPITWELIDFSFSDGGSAHGSFTYDSQLNKFSRIDIYTTAGSDLSGRHYISTAGSWGSLPQYGVLAFSDSSGPSFTGAGWFRIDARIDFEAAPGTIVNQWLAVGAESFCTNYSCSSAANEITNPGKSRDTLSGYLRAVSVDEPSSLVLLTLSLIFATWFRKSKNKLTSSSGKKSF
jgi:hypothetical protein